MQLTRNKPLSMAVPSRPPVQLVDLPLGQAAAIAGVQAQPGLRQRLEAMGLNPGQQVVVLRRAWMRGPLHVRVGMTELMLRRRDAACVDLAPLPSAA